MILPFLANYQTQSFEKINQLKKGIVPVCESQMSYKTS